MDCKDINYNGSVLQIKRFKLRMIKENAAIAMIAKRGSGKSWVCRDILQYNRDIPCGMIISPTDKMNSFYKDMFPELYIHYNFSPELLQKLLYRQELIIDKQQEKAKQGKKVDPRAFLLMDDCMGQKSSWVKDDTISEIFMNGRHYQLLYMLTMQFPLGISPSLRSNFDYIFLLGDDIISNQERIWKHYAGMFPTFDSFQSVFNVLTDDFGCMVIDNKSKSKKLTDKIFYYKANGPNSHKINLGSRTFREYHERNFDKDWRKKKPAFNINDLTKKKKNKCNFSIQKLN